LHSPIPPCDLLPHNRRNFRTKQFNGMHDLLVLNGAVADIHQEALVAEYLVLE
jgi:hypothetical protein